MPKYRVHIISEHHHNVYVEADSEQQARALVEGSLEEYLLRSEHINTEKFIDFVEDDDREGE